MKYLSEYMEDRQTIAFNKANAFFAFSTKQFDEAKKDGIKYVNLGAGLIADKTKAQALKDELETIYKECIAQDVKDNGLNAIIRRELNNHECYYSGDIEACVDKLTDYPVTEGDIMKVFKNKNAVIK